MIIRHVVFCLLGFFGVWGMALKWGDVFHIKPTKMVPAAFPEKCTVNAPPYLGRNADHDVFYHELNPEIRWRLKGSDVILFGTSTVHFGLDYKLTNDYFSKRDMRAFNLAFGAGGTMAWELQIARKYGLHDKVFLVSVDCLTYSELAGDSLGALGATRVQALKAYQEDVISCLVHSFMTSAGIPQLDMSNSPQRTFNMMAMYRRLRDGWWMLDGYTNYRNPTATLPVVKVPPLREMQATGLLSYINQAHGRQYNAEDVQAMIQEFFDYCNANRNRVVLFEVPTSVVSLDSFGRWLSEKYSFPFISCPSEGLETFDGSHLTKPSCLLFTQRFIEQLESRPDRLSP